MNSPKTKVAFYKRPPLIIFALFIAGYFLVEHFSQQLLSDAPLVLTQGESPEIIMYSTQNCPYCVLTKAFFDKHNLSFKEYDIERSEKHMEMFYLLGGRGTPLVIINKDIIHGFDERLMRKAL